MGIENMSPQNQIMIQEAKIINHNYFINWLASVYHKDILVCIKSSWLPYDEFVEVLSKHHNESIYQGDEVYWQKVTKQTSIQISTDTIKQPVDVILLPVSNGDILVPVDEDDCIRLQRTIKGTIKYEVKKKSHLFSFNAIEEITFLTKSLPTKRDDIVAEYIVDNHRYPIVAAMLEKTFSVEVPKNSTCQLCLIKEMNSKYNLRKNEE